MDTEVDPLLPPTEEDALKVGLLGGDQEANRRSSRRSLKPVQRKDYDNADEGMDLEDGDDAKEGNQKLTYEQIEAQFRFAFPALKEYFRRKLIIFIKSIGGTEEQALSFRIVVAFHRGGLTQGILTIHYVLNGKRHHHRVEVAAALQLIPYYKSARYLTRQQHYLIAVEYRERMLISQLLTACNGKCDKIDYIDDNIVFYALQSNLNKATSPSNIPLEESSEGLTGQSSDDPLVKLNFDNSYFSFGNISVLNWGHICSEPGFFNEGALFPIGFKCLRQEVDSRMGKIVDILCEVDAIVENDSTKTSESKYETSSSDSVPLFRITVAWELSNANRAVRVYEGKSLPELWQMVMLENGDSTVDKKCSANRKPKKVKSENSDIESEEDEELGEVDVERNLAGATNEDNEVVEDSDEEEVELRNLLRRTRDELFNIVKEKDTKQTVLDTTNPRLVLEEIDTFYDELVLRMLEGLEGSYKCQSYEYFESRAANIVEISAKSENARRLPNHRCYAVMHRRTKNLVKTAKRQFDVEIDVFESKRDQRSEASERRRKLRQENKELRSVQNNLIKSRNARVRKVESSVTTFKNSLPRMLKKRREELLDTVGAFSFFEEKSKFDSTEGIEVYDAQDSRKNKLPMPTTYQHPLLRNGALSSDILEIWNFLSSYQDYLQIEDSVLTDLNEMLMSFFRIDPCTMRVLEKTSEIRNSPGVFSKHAKFSGDITEEDSRSHLEEIGVVLAKKLFSEFERIYGLDQIDKPNSLNTTFDSAALNSSISNIHGVKANVIFNKNIVNALTWKEIARNVLFESFFKECKLDSLLEVMPFLKSKNHSSSLEGPDKRQIKVIRKRITQCFFVRGDFNSIVSGFNAGLTVRIPMPSHFSEHNLTVSKGPRFSAIASSGGDTVGLYESKLFQLMRFIVKIPPFLNYLKVEMLQVIYSMISLICTDLESNVIQATVKGSNNGTSSSQIDLKSLMNSIKNTIGKMIKHSLFESRLIDSLFNRINSLLNNNDNESNDADSFDESSGFSFDFRYYNCLKYLYSFDLYVDRNLQQSDSSFLQDNLPISPLDSIQRRLKFDSKATAFPEMYTNLKSKGSADNNMDNDMDNNDNNENGNEQGANDQNMDQNNDQSMDQNNDQNNQDMNTGPNTEINFIYEADLSQLSESMKRCFIVIRELIHHYLSASFCKPFTNRWDMRFYNFVPTPLFFPDISRAILKNSYQDSIYKFYIDVTNIFNQIACNFPAHVRYSNAISKLIPYFDRLFCEIVLNLNNPISFAESCIACRNNELLNGVNELDNNDSATMENIGDTDIGAVPVVSAAAPSKFVICERCEAHCHVRCAPPNVIKGNNRSDWLCPPCSGSLSSNSVAVRHPLIEAVVSHPQRTANGGTLLGQVVSIEQSKEMLVYVVNFADRTREVWSGSKVRKYFYSRKANERGLSETKAEALPDLPSGYSYDDFDATCGIVKYYKSFGTFHNQMTSFFSDDFNKFVRRDKVLDMSHFEATKLALLILFSGFTTEDYGLFEYIVIFKALIQRLSTSMEFSYHLNDVEVKCESLLEEIVGKMETNDKSYLDLLSNLAKANYEKDDVGFGQEVVQAEEEMEIEEEENLPTPPPLKLKISLPNRRNNSRLIETDSEESDNDMDIDNASAQSKSDSSLDFGDEIDDTAPEMDKMTIDNTLFSRQKGREDALLTRMRIVEALSETSILNLEDIKELEGEDVLADIGGFFSAVEPRLVRACVPNIEEVTAISDLNDRSINLLEWLKGFEAKARDIQYNYGTPGNENHLVCHLCGHPEYYVPSGFVKTFNYEEFISYVTACEIKDTPFFKQEILWKPFGRNEQELEDSDFSILFKNSNVIRCEGSLCCHLICAESLHSSRIQGYLKSKHFTDIYLAGQLIGKNNGKTLMLGRDSYKNEYYVFCGSDSLFVKKYDWGNTNGLHAVEIRPEDIIIDEYSSGNLSLLQNESSNYLWLEYSTAQEINSIMQSFNESYANERRLKRALFILFPESRDFDGTLLSLSHDDEKTLFSELEKSVDELILPNLSLNSIEIKYAVNEIKTAGNHIKDEVTADMAGSENEKGFETESEAEADDKMETDSEAEIRDSSDEQSAMAAVETETESEDEDGTDIGGDLNLEIGTRVIVQSVIHHSLMFPAVVANKFCYSDDQVQESDKLYYLLKFIGYDTDRVSWIPISQIKFVYSDESVGNKLKLKKKYFVTVSQADAKLANSRKTYLQDTIGHGPDILRSLKAYLYLHAPYRAATPARPPLAFANIANEFELVRLAMLMVEAALPLGCIDESEDRWSLDSSVFQQSAVNIAYAKAINTSASLSHVNTQDPSFNFSEAWRTAVLHASDASMLMQCMLMLECGIRTSFMKNGLRVMSCFPSRVHMLRYSNLSAVALKLWTLDQGISYDMCIFPSDQEQKIQSIYAKLKPASKGRKKS